MAYIKGTIYCIATLSAGVQTNFRDMSSSQIENDAEAPAPVAKDDDDKDKGYQPQEWKDDDKPGYKDGSPRMEYGYKPKPLKPLDESWETRCINARLDRERTAKVSPSGCQGEKSIYGPMYMGVKAPPGWRKGKSQGSDGYEPHYPGGVPPRAPDPMPKFPPPYRCP